MKKGKFNIHQFDPCISGVEFYDNYSSFEDAWEACPQGEWMLWIAQKLGVSLQTLTLAKGYCAKTVIHLMKDERNKNAVKVAIAFGKGKATKEELNIVGSQVFNYHWYATSKVSLAVTAAWCAVDVAQHDYTAAYYTARAVSAEKSSSALAEKARIKNQKQTADICRKYLTKEVFELINNIKESHPK